MNTKVILGLLFSYCLVAFSQPHAHMSPPAVDRHGWQECNSKIQGGDIFPWSNAKPFPWSDIQGVWKLSDGKVPYYLRAKVVRSTTNRKILNLAIVSEGNCTKPVAQGLGYVDFSEKNVVRAIMNDGVSKYQMKLASFDAKDLEIDSQSCGENILAASIQPIGTARAYPANENIDLDMYTGSNPENMMLKKVSDDIAAVCRKLEK